jgi:hypothetical protein
MAAESERILIHYSKKKLIELENEGTSNQMRYHFSSGKPNGFWYAYGETWKKEINSGKARRDKENTSFKYEFRLPESAFVSTIADISRDTIFELSSGNLDEFMQHFVKKEHHISMTKNEIIEHALFMKKRDGDSAILTELSRVNSVFMTEYKKLKKQMAGKKIKNKSEIEKTFSELLSTFSPSQKALKGDGLSLFDWRAFWKTVSESVGGIEFHEDLLTIDTWNDLHLTWTRPIAIHSGVIFNPSTFRGGMLIEQLRIQTAGGKRYTRKKKSKRTTRKC